MMTSIDIANSATLSQHSVFQTKECDAVVLGTPMAAAEFPSDLYIPPQALRIFLEAFTGPLDLLSYLIKKQNIDILDIPVAKVTAQYMEYLELMQDLRLELAAEYLLMAAFLVEIKSRLLLPRHNLDADAALNEDDPRVELVRRLQEYERYKKVAQEIDNLPRVERDVFTLSLEIPENTQVSKQLPRIVLQDLLLAFKDVLQRAQAYRHHKIRLENLSVRERMTQILDKLQHHQNEPIEFSAIFYLHEGKLGVVVAFLALLELLRQELVAIVQAESFGRIYLQQSAHAAH